MKSKPTQPPTPITKPTGTIHGGGDAEWARSREVAVDAAQQGRTAPDETRRHDGGVELQDFVVAQETHKSGRVPADDPADMLS
jgi:hypothetical protein